MNRMKKSLYVLEVITFMKKRRQHKDDYQPFVKEVSNVSFHKKFDEAESEIIRFLNEHSAWDDIYCFYIHQVPQNVLLTPYCLDSYAVWLYDQHGTLIDERPYPSYRFGCHFGGRPKEKLRFHIGDVALAVFRPQVHVHHEAAGLYVVAQHFTFISLLLIDFQVFHRIVRQVLHQHLVVAPEEGARTEQQFVHFSAVHENLPGIVQRHARKLPDEGVEHGAVRQLEGVGVVDQRVALVVHLHLGGRHFHLIQGKFTFFAQLDSRNLYCAD